VPAPNTAHVSDQKPAFRIGPVQVDTAGVRITGGSTAASRDYYNRLTRPLANLQIGRDFIFPLSIPAPITSLFGWRIHPIFGEQRFHAGTDLGAPLGTPVLATQAGRVIASELLGGYGLTVILQHGEKNLESRYAHLSQLLVQPGEWVNQGDVIGLVGSTGNSTGPHLHFELRQLTADGWVLVNPDDVLRYALAQLVETLNNPMQALNAAGAADATIVAEGDAGTNTMPFRPAQPNAN
jgi:murein DD-endopeptidase MepM/ murein hydrolase activator NlpD